MAGGMDTFDWLKDRIKQAQGRRRSGQRQRTARDQGRRGRPRDRRHDHADRVTNNPLVKEQFPLLAAGGAARRLAADSQPGHGRRQRVAGRALLVLPRRLAVLPRRRQHLLRRHADGGQSRARDLRRRSLRRGEPVRHRAGADRARRRVRDQQRRRRARRSGPRVLHRPRHRHHQADGAAAGRPADGDPHSRHVGGQGALLREGARPPGVGLRARQHRRVARTCRARPSATRAWW